MTSGRWRRRAKAEKRRERWRKQYHSAGFVFFTHQQQCVVPGCRSRIMDAAHCRSRGAGGTWRDIFPACHAHHMEQERGIVTFQEKHGLNLRRLADEHVAAWVRLSQFERDEYQREALARGYREP